ncbi:MULTISPECIES: hypothetical protein [unclassified Pseudomonas]|uniref:hypothetical protein n=1 Tax=unclassified Pseudomonas TaxID=196821 RepID=UPI003FA19F98
MAGQIITLSGVTAAASLGAPRIDMSTPDTVAARIASLKHVVSPRALVALASGGVSGRCRATGLELVPKGVVTGLQLSDVAGRRALGLTTILATSLGLPPGSKTSSYTLVAAVSIGQADIDSTAVSTSPILVGGSDSANNFNMNALQYFGAAGTPPNIFTARGNDLASPFASSVRPNGSWAIVVVDYNNETRTASLAVNQADTFATVTKAAGHSPGAGDYLEIGNHSNQTSSLRSSKVGDLYTFSSSLLANSLGRQQLQTLVAALKTYYSIA